MQSLINSRTIAISSKRSAVDVAVFGILRNWQPQLPSRKLLCGNPSRQATPLSNLMRHGYNICFQILRAKKARVFSDKSCNSFDDCFTVLNSSNNFGWNRMIEASQCHSYRCQIRSVDSQYTQLSKTKLSSCLNTY